MQDISKISNSNGFIKIAAFDHRDSMKKFVAADKIADFKTLLAETFADVSTAILVDPEYGSNAIAAARAKNIGVLLSREKSGYQETEEDVRPLNLYDAQYNSENLKKLGADAVKILVYYNPDSENTEDKLDVVEKVKHEAHGQHMPLLIEPIVYKLSSQSESDFVKAEQIVASAVEFQAFADVLKIEFPVDLEKDSEENARKYLADIQKNITRPWVILSRGMKYDFFKKAVQLSKEYGSVGYAVGRGVWQEVAEIKDWAKVEEFIKTTAHQRMKELSDIFA